MAFARIAWGMPFSEAGELSLRMWSLLQEQWMEEQRRQDWRAAAIYCALAGRRAKPWDAFPSLKPRKKTPEELVARLKDALGGRAGK